MFCIFPGPSGARRQPLQKHANPTPQFTSTPLSSTEHLLLTRPRVRSTFLALKWTPTIQMQLGLRHPLYAAAVNVISDMPPGYRYPGRQLTHLVLCREDLSSESHPNLPPSSSMHLFHLAFEAGSWENLEAKMYPHTPATLPALRNSMIRFKSKCLHVNRQRRQLQHPLPETQFAELTLSELWVLDISEGRTYTLPAISEHQHVPLEACVSAREACYSRGYTTSLRRRCMAPCVGGVELLLRAATTAATTRGICT
ncbi:hypothetical protein B0H11DRAFT_1328940 [Mycena galericulata]|nr:hypothetical protein B0H11DRAFT_1328940 [Mycena galericulata]